jgi:hypothetical protein
MNREELSVLVPADFADSSRVWIYQSNRPFNDKEVTEIREQLLHFYSQWVSHMKPVKGWADVLFRRYIVIMADETDVAVGGCSTDDSMRMIKSLERQYQVVLFDRLTLTFLVNNKTEMLPLSQVQYALDNGFITGDALFFNNLAATKKDLLENWLIPVKDSWLAARLVFK